ncbi:MAG: DUF4349 domain-containing protein [Acidobacteria bacterium]|nr:DUF4349 domain-containing protein [Acidobacteriota bacterium]MBI3489865.1 DUF4349 domain-containing protein [Acidobacteriota bacterium]
MKWRPWMKVTIAVFASILVLILANAIMESHKERIRQAQERVNGGSNNTFGPRELFMAAGPFSGLMESIRPGFAVRGKMKTVGLDLVEASDKTSTSAPPPGMGPLKLIRTGQMSIEVPEFERAAKDLAKLVEGLGGYVADTQVRRNPSGSRSGSISLRVPAASYESAGSGIRTLGKVMSESSNVQDVTKAYSDLETRLRVKREALNRIRELLRAKAGNLKEVLEAERELSRITEEIEQAEGERRFFDHQISLSTILVEIAEPEPISLARPSSWWALSESLRDSAAMVAGSLAFMLRLVFVLLPWAVAGWCVMAGIRWARRKRARRNESQESTVPTPELARGPEHDADLDLKR